MSERPDRQGDEAPEARNPFEERPDHEANEKPALISTKRSAALFGVLAGLGLLILIVAICVLGNIAFG